MKTLILDITLVGHHLEYLHHLYIGASEKAENEYFFAVPGNEWRKMKDKLQWKTAPNINWIMLDDIECQQIQSGSMVARCIKISKFIKQLVLKYDINDVFLISLTESIPVLPIILPERIKVSGIIYKIYLRAKRSLVRNVIDKIRYTIIRCNKSVKKVFILNDLSSTIALNRIYKTDKFIMLPDPVPDVDIDSCNDIRQSFNIPQKATVFLHFGAMDRRKGTLEILKATQLLTSDQLMNIHFIFAGKVSGFIRDEFYMLVEKAREKGANITIEDDFISYERINDFCHSSNAILAPYLLTDLSSGVIGYGAVHNIPIIGPSNGLIGELIRDNGLGLTIDKISPESISDVLIAFKPNKIYSEYTKTNTIPSFLSTIFK